MTILNFSDTGVVGILVSVLFGGWGVYLALRRTKYQASLTFVREQTVSLLDDFATRIPNLSVLYKDTPIDKSVVLLSGYLMNDGNIDITPQMTERPLACELPDGWSWLEFKLTGATEELNATGEIKSPQVLELNFGLFRRDEVFSFQALAVLSTDYAKKKPTALAKALRWSHRIASLGAVRTIKLPEEKSKRERWIRKGGFMLLASFYLFFGLSIATDIDTLIKLPYIAYESIENGKTSTVRLTPNQDGTTTVTDLATGKEQRLKLSQYTKGAMLKPIYQERRKPDNIMILFGLFLILMAFPLLYLAFGDDYKRFRFRRVIAVSARET
ncbi:MAG: hypothetical protein V8K32_03100 [Candidatus Electrothrix gigas]